jgi:hypothetical protein
MARELARRQAVVEAAGLGAFGGDLQWQHGGTGQMGPRATQGKTRINLDRIHGRTVGVGGWRDEGGVFS